MNTPKLLRKAHLAQKTSNFIPSPTFMTQTPLLLSFTLGLVLLMSVFSVLLKVLVRRYDCIFPLPDEPISPNVLYKIETYA